MKKSKCPVCGFRKWTKPKWALKNQQRECKRCKSITNKSEWSLP